MILYLAGDRDTPMNLAALLHPSSKSNILNYIKAIIGLFQGHIVSFQGQRPTYNIIPRLKTYRVFIAETYMVISNFTKLDYFNFTSIISISYFISNV